MAEFCMCKNKACPSAAKCYRFTAPVAPPPRAQSFANYFIERGHDRCTHFKIIPE